MKKEKQEYINSICTYVYEKAMKEYESSYLNCGRLRSCSAEVLETENYFLLRSYNTIVGVMHKSSRELIDVLRLSMDIQSHLHSTWKSSVMIIMNQSGIPTAMFRANVSGMKNA